MECEEEPVRCPDSGVLGNLGRLGIAQTLRLFSDLGKIIGDGTRKKSTLRPSLLETERGTLFYCNSLKAILNPQQLFQNLENHLLDLASAEHWSVSILWVED